MPEMKNTFSHGKMNKDLDERVIPKGHYRDAMNIQVSTSDSSDVGTVQSLLGNSLISLSTGDAVFPNGMECVGSIADETDDSIYYFVTDIEGFGLDAIIQLKQDNLTPVLIDTRAGTNKAVLKFEEGNNITGINIISEKQKLLLWTDNQNEPKKINIGSCIKGSGNIDSHTKLFVDNQPVIENITLKSTSNATNTFVIDVNFAEDLEIGYKLTDISGNLPMMGSPAPMAGILPWITSINYDTNQVTLSHPLPNVESIDTFNFEGEVTIREEHITIIKKKPTKPLKVLAEDHIRKGKIDGYARERHIAAKEVGDTYNIFIELTDTEAAAGGVNLDIQDIILLNEIDVYANPLGILPTPLSYGVKGVIISVGTVIDVSNYANQYSNTGWRQLIVIKILDLSPALTASWPGVGPWPPDWRMALEDRTIQLYESKFVRFGYRYKYDDGEYSAFSPFTDVVFIPGTFDMHPTREPYNLGMVNTLKRLKLQDFIAPDMPDNVVQIDLLYKEEGAPQIYSIASVKYDDPVIASTDPDFEISTSDIANTWNSSGSNINSKYKGSYVIDSENVHFILPENQSLRHWDNVPIKALGQEITGSRLVYSNYLQNRNLIDNYGDKIVPHSSISLNTRKIDWDEYILEEKAKNSIKLSRTYGFGVIYCDKYGRETPVFPIGPKLTPFYVDNEEKRIDIDVLSNPPNWASHYKIFIKETSDEYYNLAMDRAYRAEEDENLWMSFASSDRNKLLEGDYLILKKGLDHTAPIEDKNKFKIIDIKNEAPHFVKNRRVLMGTADGTYVLGTPPSTTPPTVYPSTLWTNNSFIPALSATTLHISRQVWEDSEGGAGGLDGLDDPYIIFEKPNPSGPNLMSSEYKVLTIEMIEDSAGDDTYKIRLEKPISPEDDWVSVATKMHIWNFVQKETQEFEGRFFVKIKRNQLTLDFVEVGLTSISALLASSAIIPTYYLKDGTTGSGANIGTTNNGEGSWRPDDWYGSGGIMEFGTGAFKSAWIIDDMHFKASQHRNSVSVKYSGDMGHQRNPQGDVFSYSFQGSHPDFQELSNYFLETYAHNGNQYWLEQDYLDNFETYQLGALDDAMGGIIVASVDNEHLNVNGGPPFGTGYNVWWNGIGSGTSDHGPSSYWGSYQQTPLNQTQNYFSVGGNESNPTTYYQDGEIYLHLSFVGPGKDLYVKHQDITTGIQWTSPTAFTTVANTIDNFFSYSLQQQTPQDHITELQVQCIHDPGSSTHEATVAHGQQLPFSTFGLDEGAKRRSHQWEPTFQDDGGLQDANIVIKEKLKPGSHIQFQNDVTSYEIKSITKRRLYNHTPWFSRGMGDSVMEAYETFQNFANQNDYYFPDSIEFAKQLDNKLYDFGHKSNRRVCYIIKLTADPTGASTTYNPITSGDFTPTSAGNIRIMEDYRSEVTPELPAEPAIWETEPRKSMDLDIYYETSQAYPLELNRKTNELLGIVGCRVTCNLKAANMMPSPTTTLTIPTNTISINTLVSWSNRDIVLSPGLHSVYWDEDGNPQLIEYDRLKLKLWKDDYSYTTVAIESAEPADVYGGYTTNFRLKKDVPTEVGLPWYNCFDFHNGVESDRIRDDFNKMTIINGVKASTTIEEPYTEERRRSGLIYSGIYNSTSGINNLNQFIMAEKITKDLNPSYGSIQKLHSRNTDLVTICEDKTLRILANKDALFNADGNTNVVSNENVLGQAVPFVGEYGISTDPESFASESYRVYFADRQRGAVLRLSKDGLTPISDAGMRDYFRDNLKDSYQLRGSFDNHKKEYNLTIDSPGGVYLDSTTVSFSEDVRGWVSFKSFIPESGVSIANNYYTFFRGNPYKHHSNQTRNMFYGTSQDSSVTTILNDSPEAVKNFHNITYEGSQARINQFQTDVDSGLNNRSYYNINSSSGWYCEEIITDKQEGSLTEFIEKEGKWFNHIKGHEKDGVLLDIAASNFQGIGASNDIVAA